MFSFYGKPVLLSRQSQQIFSCAHRSLATKIKKSALLQDTERIPIVKYPRSTAKDRRVYVWGLAETGALGLQKSLRKASERHTAVVQHPSRLQFGEHLDVCDIACGYGFSAFAVRNESTGDNDGYSLFGSGLNTDSQIGFHKRGGETNQPLQQLIYPAPIQLPVADRSERIQIVACAAGRAHLMALSETGRVYTMGNNAYGQCGRSVVNDEKYAESSLVHQIDGIDGEKIQSIHCGQDHSLWLTETGKVYACGWGADGQTGLGHYSSVAVPSLVAGDIAGEKIIKLAGTADCVLALNEKGQVFGWGNAEYGQLETIGDTQQINVPQMLMAKTKGLGRIVDIAAGGSFCMILNDEGDVFVWGYGILGLGPNVDYEKDPKLVPATLFGRNQFNATSRVCAISCGMSHMAAITDDHNAYLWGRNKFGCLGLGHQKDQMFPFKVAVGAKVLKISCGIDHTLALCQPFV